VGAVLVVFIATGVIADLVFEQVPHLEDEVAYLFQAQVFSLGKPFVTAPFRTNCFFAPFVLDHQGRRFGKYPPGWPALLSLGVRLGQPWWMNAICSSLAIALIFRLGCEMHDALTAVVAAGLATTSPFLLLLSGSMMSHACGLVFTTAFMWCFWRCCLHPSVHIRQSGVLDRLDRWALTAGVMLGCAFIVRPFTAFAIAIPAGVHTLWRLVRHREWRRVWFMGVGFMPLALVVPLFNAIWTGDPLLSPYALFWPYDRLGFGPGHGPLEGGNTVWLGLSGAVASIGHLANHLQGWPTQSLTFVVLFFMFKPRRRADVFLICNVLALVLAYVLYWTNGDVFGPRYTYESVSALFVLSAAGIVRVERWMRDKGHRQRLAFRVGFALLVGIGLLVYLPLQFQRYYGLYGITARSRDILKRADLHNALVIVRDERGWYDYAVAFSLNVPTLDGNVVYASECPHYEKELLSHFSDRAIFVFDGQTVRPCEDTGGSAGLLCASIKKPADSGTSAGYDVESAISWE
jgi:hypothetical protein